MLISTQEHIGERVASASRAELKELRHQAVAVLERVQSVRKYRLRSKVEEIEAEIAIETLIQVEAALKWRSKWFLGYRRFQLRVRYLR
jgi:hypothetical protein